MFSPPRSRSRSIMYLKNSTCPPWYELIDMPVFLQRRRDDLLDRAVVTQMDHFGAHTLQNAPHDVDRCVVAVEQRCRGDEPDFMCGTVVREFLDLGEVGHPF